MRRSGGFVLAEALAILVVLVIFCGLLVPSLSGCGGSSEEDSDAAGAATDAVKAFSKARRRALSLRDQNYLRQLHAAMVTWSINWDGRYPTPGHVIRIGNVPGRGEEDKAINTTDNLYAVMLAQNVIPTELLVSPVETNARVREDIDYDWDKINLPNDIYWDDALDVDLDGSDSGECNASYAHTLIAGDRARKVWRNTVDSKSAIIGNRGVYGGSTDSPDYVASNTLRFRAPDDAWLGSVCFADNHVETFDTFTPIGLAYDDPHTGELAKDNLFRNDTDPKGLGGTDNWLTICSAMAGDADAMTAALEWD